MKKQLRNKWTKGLRSGEYKQGSTYLRSTTDEYCCLGVLLDVSGARWTKGTNYAYACGTGSESRTNLSKRRMAMFGIDAETVNTLMHMNDHDGKSFIEIAEYIEAKL